MDTFPLEDEGEHSVQTLPTEVSSQHMVDINPVEDFDSSLDGTVVLNPSHCEDVAKMLKQMQERSDMCDICLKIGNFDQAIPAHRCILAANSPVFYTILQDTEGSEVNIPMNPSFEDVSVESFHSFLRYLYKGELRVNLFNMESILRLSTYFSIQEIALLCSKYMQDVIDITNWAYFQNLTTKYALGVETELKILEFVFDNLPFLVHSDGILAIRCEELLHILRQENTRRESEIEACKLEIILRWISSDYARGDIFSELIACVDTVVVKMADIKKLMNSYASVISLLPHTPWVTFQENVSKHKIKSDHTGDNEDKYLGNTSDFCDFNVGVPQTVEINLLNAEEESERSVVCQQVTERHNQLTMSSNVTTKVEHKVSDQEHPTTLVPKTEDPLFEESSVVLKQSQNAQRKHHDKRKARYPVKLNVQVKKSRKGSQTNSRMKHPNKLRKPRMKTAGTQVSFQEIEVNLDETFDEIKGTQIKSRGEDELHSHSSDSEDGDNARGEFIPEHWDDETEISDTDALKTEDVTDRPHPKVIIIGHNQLQGKIRHRLLSTAKSAAPRIKRLRAKKATTEAEMYHCEKCPRKFVTPSALRHHMKGHGANQPFLCEICGFSTIHFASMNVHKRQHNDQLRYHCTWPGCNYNAIRRSRLDDHLAAHNGIKNYVCSTCGKAFSGRKHLHRHEQIHRDVRLKCTECTYESPRKDKLRDHLKKHHPEIALLQGIMTTDQVQKLRPIMKPRKVSGKRSRKSMKDRVEAGEEFRHEEDQKAASVLQSESILTAGQSVLNTGIQPSYITLPQLLTGAQNVPDELLQYMQTIVAPPQQTPSQPPTSQVTSAGFIQPATSQQFYVSDSSSSVVEPSDSVSKTSSTLSSTTTTSSPQVPATIESAQQWYFVQYTDP